MIVTGLQEEGSEATRGRALWALGVCVGQTRDRELSHFANRIFAEALRDVVDLKDRRSWAFSRLGIHAYLRRRQATTAPSDIRATLTDRLMKRFAKHTREDWH